MCVVCTCPDFKETESDNLIKLHIIERWTNVIEEGPEDLFFIAAESTENGNDINELAKSTNDDEANDVQIAHVLQNRTNFSNLDEICLVVNGIIDIDDDNQPVSDNIPNSNDNDNENECINAKSWGHTGVCYRTQSGARDRPTRLKNHSSEMNLSRLQSFEILFPTEWIKEVVIPFMNSMHNNKLTYLLYI